MDQGCLFVIFRTTIQLAAYQNSTMVDSSLKVGPVGSTNGEMPNFLHVSLHTTGYT